MDVKRFRGFLQGRNFPEDRMEAVIAGAERFEEFLSSSPYEGGRSAVDAFSHQLIAEGINEYDAFLAVVQYGRFTGDSEMVIAAIELLDGAEVLDNLYSRLAEIAGEEKRDAVFFEVALPPLGTLPQEKPDLTAKLINRMETMLSPETTHSVLKDSLRDLPDSFYQGNREKYLASQSLPDFLARKGDEFIVLLEEIKENDGLFFTQPVTDEVIAYVEAHPEVRQGVLQDGQIIEAKIPYQTAAFLEETDPQMQAYYYCHCPWVRESIRSGDVTVSSTFCTCSAGYHKRYWEMTLGQPLEAKVLETVLDGAPWCKFAISLPEVY
ncbi:MAG: hypothetical protein ACK2T7_12910 [Anaerolineales bacterium]